MRQLLFLFIEGIPYFMNSRDNSPYLQTFTLLTYMIDDLKW